MFEGFLISVLNRYRLRISLNKKNKQTNKQKKTQQYKPRFIPPLSYCIVITTILNTPIVDLGYMTASDEKFLPKSGEDKSCHHLRSV